MSEIINKINKLKDAYRDANDGMSPMQLFLDAADTKALAEHRANVDRFPVKILGMTIHENAEQTRVD